MREIADVQTPAAPQRAARVRGIPWILLLIALSIYVMGGLEGLDRIVRDSQFRLAQKSIDSDLVLIDIDAKSLRQLDTWPWPRSYHARLLRELHRADPALIAFDIDFSSRTTSAEDTAFAEALRAMPAGQVILPAFLQYVDAQRQHVIANYPVPELSQHARLASINLYPSSDGLVRSVSLRTADHPPRTRALAQLLSGQSNVVPELVYLNFGIAPESFQHISYVDILNGRYDPASLAGRKVIVGATAIELRDQVAVPLHRALSGPVVQALAYESLRNPLRRISLVANTLLAAMIGTALIFTAYRHGSTRPRAWLAIVAASAIYGTATVMHLWTGILIDIAPIILIIVLSYLVGLLIHIDRQSIQSLAQKVLLRSNQKLLSTIHTNSQEGIIHLNADGLITSLNPAAQSMFRCSPEAASGLNIGELLPGITLSESANAEVFASHPDHRGMEVIAKRPDGGEFVADIVMAHAQDVDASTTTIFIHDITTQKQQQELLEFQATHDSVTGLHNKTCLAASIDDDLRVSNNTGSAALLIIGFNSFEDINTTLGHSAGDSLLKIVADRLTDITRMHACSTAKLDGDEFAIWINSATDRHQVLASDIQKMFETPIRIGGIQIELGARIGISRPPEHGTSAANLIKNARTALQTARTGTDGIAVFSGGTGTHNVRRLTLTSELRKALAENQLSLHFQPKLDLRNGRIASAEALLRWKHADSGFIPPEEFINAAENSGLIKPLTNWCIRAALKQHLLWLEQGINLRIAVNISARLLQEDVLIELLDQLTLQHPNIADALTLEITESAVMTDRSQALEVLRKLADGGYRISLDDFGTGHSAFAYLKDLPVHELKIDKCFVLNMHENMKDQKIVSSMIELAHSLGLEVVAEGVESIAIQTWLQRNGCDYAQGFGISRPLPAHELTVLLCGERKSSRI